MQDDLEHRGIGQDCGALGKGVHQLRPTIFGYLLVDHRGHQFMDVHCPTVQFASVRLREPEHVVHQVDHPLRTFLDALGEGTGLVILSGLCMVVKVVAQGHDVLQW